MTMTKTEQRRINAQLRDLRAGRKALLTGKPYANTGVPWCAGPGSPGHQDPGCDGCATAALCRWKAGHLTTRIQDLETRLTPATQDALF